MKTMISKSYGAMTDPGIAYDDWKPDNFRLIYGEIVFLDLEKAYDLNEAEQNAKIVVPRLIWRL